MRDRDKFRGCLIGGAAGDALGYAVEFLPESSIFRRFGAQGITEYALEGGNALISDDTQMTLFTANGLLLRQPDAVYPDAADRVSSRIGLCYRDWLATQLRRLPPPEGARYAWLGNIAGLYSARAPGNTCMSALGSGRLGSVDRPINQSKGCGGVMRVAPIGLYFNDRSCDIREICRLGAEAAALTHGHPLGWMPAAALVQIIHEISQNGESIPEAVRHAMRTLGEMWPDGNEKTYLLNLMDKAVRLAGEDVSDLDGIHQLGEGWVAEETLAIAVFCALRYSGNLDGALIASVNHKGDSDSTGAVTGNIIGAQVGLSGIPSKYTEHLELKELLLEIADDLWLDRWSGEEDPESDPLWKSKYIDISRGQP